MRFHCIGLNTVHPNEFSIWIVNWIDLYCYFFNNVAECNNCPPSWFICFYTHYAVNTLFSLFLLRIYKSFHSNFVLNHVHYINHTHHIYNHITPSGLWILFYSSFPTILPPLRGYYLVCNLCFLLCPTPRGWQDCNRNQLRTTAAQPRRGGIFSHYYNQSNKYLSSYSISNFLRKSRYSSLNVFFR